VIIVEWLDGQTNGPTDRPNRQSTTGPAAQKSVRPSVRSSVRSLDSSPINLHSRRSAHSSQICDVVDNCEYVSASTGGAATYFLQRQSSDMDCTSSPLGFVRAYALNERVCVRSASVHVCIDATPAHSPCRLLTLARSSLMHLSGDVLHTLANRLL